MGTVKRMNVISIMISAMVAGGLYGCQEEDNPNVEFDRDTVEMEAFADADYDEIDDLVSVGIVAADLPSEPGTRVVENIDDGRFACATVNFNREAKTITIDFGEGCEGPRGRVRSGIIQISYSGAWYVPGSVVATELQNFAIDGRKIEGTRTVTNVSESILGVPTFNITLSGGKVTFENGTVATREVNRTRQWIRATSPVNDEFHILSGSMANGVNRIGTDYESEVIDPLVYKRACRDDLVILPVSGLKQIKSGNNIIVIDFGDGECDNIITVSFNGVISTLEISPRAKANS